MNLSTSFKALGPLHLGPLHLRPLQLSAIVFALGTTVALTAALQRPVQAVEPAPTQPASKPTGPAPNSKTPPPAVLDKFFNYLNGSYSLWLGDSRGACSYHVDPAGIHADGNDRFFLAKISRSEVGTGCRGILAFRVMQADCKAKKLYEFVREQKEDMRVAGWERYESILRDPAAGRSVDSTPQKPETTKPETTKPEVQSQKALTTICGQ